MTRSPDDPKPSASTLIYRSHGKIPLAFLRGAGVPDNFIEYMAPLTGKALEFYSCFISYSTKDQEFADRLHDDLQNKGVRCWFAPHDLKIGDREKLLLTLSDLFFDHKSTVPSITDIHPAARDNNDRPAARQPCARLQRRAFGPRRESPQKRSLTTKRSRGKYAKWREIRGGGPLSLYY